MIINNRQLAIISIFFQYFSEAVSWRSKSSRKSSNLVEICDCCDSDDDELFWFPYFFCSNSTFIWNIM